ncbi:8120_t:CDS:2, partial [Gigaspora margarita]
ILDQNAHLFNNKTGKIVKTYIKSRGFFDNILDLSNVLKPISDTIICLESKMANLANCYLGYIKLAIAIKNIFQDHHLMFYWKCVSIFNERFHAFDYNKYLLAYYLHPKYRVAGIAGCLWTKMIGSKIKKADLEILKAQLCKYACNEKPYNGSYVSAIDSPTQYSYLISNAKQELHYYGLELTEKEIQTVFQDIALFSEDEEEENFDNLDESEDLIDSDIKNQNLEIENLIALNNIESNNDNENINDNNNNLNKDLNNDEIEKFDED